MNEFEEFEQRRLELIRSMSQVAELVDGLKTSLEARDWDTTSAIQASIVISNTMLMMSGGGVR